MQHILVLCIGNICRSPIAHVLLARELPDRIVLSAGLGAMVGEPADPHSVAVVADAGLDLGEHRAQQVNRALCQWADLILVMEEHHRVELERRYPLVRGKVFRLDEKADIADPYRKPRYAFENAYDGIARGVASWAERIRKLG